MRGDQMRGQVVREDVGGQPAVRTGLADLPQQQVGDALKGESTDDSPFLTIDETAELLRVKRRTLDNLRWSGDGPPARRCTPCASG
jgi:hypothetical protein